MTSRTVAMLVGLCASVIAAPAGAQTTANEKISIHEPEIRITERDLRKSVSAQTPPDSSVELKVGAEVQARNVNIVLTNVNIDGTFFADLRSIVERLKSSNRVPPKSPDAQKQPVSR